MPAKDANFIEVRQRSGKVLHLPACYKCDKAVKREDHLTFEGNAYHRYCFKCTLTGKSLVGEEIIVWKGKPYLKAALLGRDHEDVEVVNIWTNGGYPLVEGADFLDQRPAPVRTWAYQPSERRPAGYHHGEPYYPASFYPYDDYYGPEYGDDYYTDYYGRGYSDRYAPRGYDSRYGRQPSYGPRYR